MLKIGLTGGIGSGKSTVSKYLIKRGIPIVDADIIAREVLSIYKEINMKIKETFGEEFFDEEAKLKRRELGAFVFKSEEKRIALENIIIPFIIKEVFVRLEVLQKEGHKICIVDAPTLIEHNLHKKMDYNILVWVDRETQIERVKNRDSLTIEEVIDRIDAQMPLENKRKEVNFIVDNRGEIYETIEQVEDVLKTLERFEGENENREEAH